MWSYGTQYRSTRVVSWSLPILEIWGEPAPTSCKESLKFYKEQLKFVDKDKALAFYFFEHRNLSVGVKAGIKTAYNQFKLKYCVFSIDNLKNYFTNLDITNSMASSSLSLHWERMKRFAICSFGIKGKIFQKSYFQAINKEGKIMFQLLTKINTSKLQIFFMQKANMKMHYSFISCGLLHLSQMRCSHWDLKILKTKMDKNLFCIMQTRRIKGRSSLSLKKFMPKLWTLKRWK